MKKYLFIAASALALASCSSEDFVGTEGGNVETSANKAINFGGGTGKITRAVLNGEKAAEALQNNFVVFGYKTYSDNTTSTVFDHYTINWNNKAGQTVSNKNGWEYVGIKPNKTLSSVEDQTIKYWDYSAKQYDYIAFSFGTATQGTEDGEVEASKITTASNISYTLKGAVKDLAKCFIADRITAKKDLTNEQKKSNKLVRYNDDVQFNFRSLSTKVTMGIYEIIPGYSVRDVTFYSAENTKLEGANNKPTLYAAAPTIPYGKGSIAVSFSSATESETDYNKAHVKFTVAEGSTNSSSISFGTLSTVNKEKNEKVTSGFIGRDITTFSTPKKDDGNKDYEVVIPAQIGDLTLKVDYTLESIDGSGETIKVTGATAVVPAKYTNWEPNYAYTYIFKISDKTNGSTGGDKDPKGLYPITFDAIVTETETGKQETITTVENNSITTYAKDEINNEYKTDANIYVSVNNKTPLHIKNGDEDITPTNVKLYTAVGTGSYETITEAIVAHCLASGTATGTTTGEKKLSTGDNSTLTVTPAKGLSIVAEIEAKDAVDGNAIKGNFAKFTPKEEGTYVFEFTDSNKAKYYKVIKVKKVTATK